MKRLQMGRKAGNPQVGEGLSGFQEVCAQDYIIFFVVDVEGWPIR